MHRKASSVLAAVAVATLATSAFAGPPLDSFETHPVLVGAGLPSRAVLYDNTPTGAETIFSTTSVPRTGGADEALFNGPGANLTSMVFGFLIATNGPTAFDARIRLWDDIEPTGSTVAGVPQFQNLVKDFTVSFAGQIPGAFISNPVAIPTGGANVTANPVTLGAPNITDVYVQLDFYNAGTQTHVTGNTVTYIFDGSGTNTGFTFDHPSVGGPGTGAGDLYWRDANDNQIISVEEGRAFALPNRGNFVLRFEGTIIPEPASLSLLSLGGLSLIRRRRSH